MAARTTVKFRLFKPIPATDSASPDTAKSVAEAEHEHLLFLEDDPSFGSLEVIISREECARGTISKTIEDAKDDMDDLAALVAKTTISPHIPTDDVIEKGHPSYNGKEEIYFLQTGSEEEPRISVLGQIFSAPMRKASKAFAYLDRGTSYKDIFAVSGYKGGRYGGIDGCLDREEWTRKVKLIAEFIGHTFNHPEPYYVSHVEKQLIAYFLWNHTTLGQLLDEKCTQKINLESFKPVVLGMKKDIYVNKPCCSDCKGFRGRVEDMTGVDFNIIFCETVKL